MMWNIASARQTMSEKEMALQRVQEKEKLRKAWRNMTQLFIGTSAIIFLTFIIVWGIQLMPTIHIPIIYKWNALVVVVSSLFAFQAQRCISADHIHTALKYSAWTLIFGMLFLALQWVGWHELLQSNQGFRNILFPFAFIHILHVVIGLLLLSRVLLKLRNYQVHSKEMAFVTNVFRFWHFLGLVWIAVMFLL